jgi:uncharacterized protein YbjT (DUF2867 family)
VNIKKICILGGTGFVGHHLASRLSSAGMACRIVTRHPQRHRDMRVLPEVEILSGNLHDAADLERCLQGCEAAINLVGILNESGGANFRQMHVDLVDRIVEAGQASGIRRLLHMSALNASASSGTSEYLRSKGEGENQAHTRGHSSMKVTSFRPSVIFGSGDSFFNRFAGLLKMAPGVFPLACPETRFQPIYVGDVAEAFARALNNRSTWGQHYDLCGPGVFTLRELVEYTAQVIGKPVRVIGLNDFLARAQARVMGALPGKPFSMDNYLSLQMDSLCQSNDLEKLGISATDVASVVPLYLGALAQRSRYMALRKVS